MLVRRTPESLDSPPRASATGARRYKNWDVRKSCEALAETLLVAKLSEVPVASSLKLSVDASKREAVPTKLLGVLFGAVALLAASLIVGRATSAALDEEFSLGTGNRR